MCQLKVLLFSLIFFASSTNVIAAACPEGELKFSFKNIEVKTAFAIFADFSGTTPVIDSTISYSAPLNFECTPWKIAAQNLADRYKLNIEVKNGAMTVSK